MIYRLEFGWQRQLHGDGPLLSASIVQRGIAAVDRKGHRWLRSLELAAQSAEWRSGSDDELLQWRLAIGSVFDQQTLDHDAVLEAGARLLLLGTPFGFEFKGSSLIGGTQTGSEWQLGPTYRIRMAGNDDNRLTLFAAWLESDSPLGLGESGFLAGVEFEGLGRGPQLSPPEIAGTVGFGYGEDQRAAAQLKLHIESPAIAKRWRGVLEVDAHTLSADDTTELYYLYHLGVERFDRGMIYGGYFYHRSNHQVDNPAGLSGIVTSINVAEVGWETDGWRSGGAGGTRRPRWGLEARLRVGWLIDSAFGETRNWHARGGVRWRSNLPLSPYVHLEFEDGDVGRRLYALGFNPTSFWEVQLEWQQDDQWFAEDDTAWLLTQRLRFGYGSSRRSR